MNQFLITSIFKNKIRISLLFGYLVFSLFALADVPLNVVEAHFVASTTEVQPNEIVYFNNNSTNAISYEWQLDGVFQSLNENFDFTFVMNGVYEVSLIAADAICQDTFRTLITVSEIGFAKLGMPIWPSFSRQDDKITLFDWRQFPYVESAIPNTDFSNKSKVNGGFTNCGELAFVIFHNGSPDPNSLFVFDVLGNELLTNNSGNGGGLNGVGGSGELQVVKVPGLSNEWYIIYSEWNLDNSVYTPAKILYSRIQLLPTGVLNVLIRDQVLVDNTGTAYNYLDGKAVSRKAGGNLNAHYLYACRRDENVNSISLDRFLINSNGIAFEANTGNVPCEWWALSIARSPIELSPSEDVIAVNVRNQKVDNEDVFLFDATSFNNTNVQIINADRLKLVADGGPNDLTSLLTNSDIVSNIAANPNLNLSYLSNFSRKFRGMEFSPNGRFLYLIGGGYPGISGATYITYLAQIDLETSPLEVRLQIQTTPNNIYSNFGVGCATNDCSSEWRFVNGLESGFDGNLYFNKKGGGFMDPTLFVLPDPNNFMPQNLSPSFFDLSTTDDPNIPSDFIKWESPDQIDGFNYLIPGYKEVEIIVTKLNCANECMAPFILDVTNQGELITSFKIESCPDTFYLCADPTLVYALNDPLADSSIDDAITSGVVNYPINTNIFYLPSNESIVLESKLALPADVTINLGQMYEIQSQTTITADSLVFNWNPIETLSCDNCNNPTATPFSTTLYTLTLQDDFGCTVHDDILITVQKERNVYIPNIFSPNGDGQNDKLIIFSDSGVKQVLTFRVFNRWGALVYEELNFQPNDPNHGWDGTFKGAVTSSAVFGYYAELEFVDGEIELFEGDVSIIW